MHSSVVRDIFIQEIPWEMSSQHLWSPGGDGDVCLPDSIPWALMKADERARPVRPRKKMVLRDPKITVERPWTARQGCLFPTPLP